MFRSFGFFEHENYFGILIFLASYCAASAQTTVMADNVDDGCRIKLEKIKSKIEARRKRYEFYVQEYQQGLFCSECGRTKSEIEDRAHLNFDQHIRDGAAHNRHSLIATQELYHNLYKDYLIDFNDLKKEYDDKYNDCGGDSSSPALAVITDQQFQLSIVELHAPVIPYNTQMAILRIDYTTYYALMMKISITWWQTTTIETTTWFTKLIHENGTAENAIDRAGSLLYNYAHTPPVNQNDFFWGMDTQPTWHLKGKLKVTNK